MPMNGRRWASSNANKHNGITLWFLAAAFFLKGVLYRSMTAMDVALNAGQVAAAYLSVAAAALFLAAAVWLTRRWPAVIILVFSDLWLLAGIWYYRANILWLTWGAVQTITELNGFADSIAVYLSWSQFFFPLLTVLAVMALFIMPHPSPTWRERWIGVVIVLSLCLCAGLLRITSIGRSDVSLRGQIQRLRCGMLRSSSRRTIIIFRSKGTRSLSFDPDDTGNFHFYHDR